MFGPTDENPTMAGAGLTSNRVAGFVMEPYADLTGKRKFSTNS